MRRPLTALAVAVAFSLVAGPASAERADVKLLGRVTASVALDGVVSTNVAFKCPKGQDYGVYVSAEQVFGTLPDGLLDAATGDNVNWINDGNADLTFTTGTCTGKRQRAVAIIEDESNPFRQGSASFTVEVASFVQDEPTNGDGFTGTLTIR